MFLKDFVLDVGPLERKEDGVSEVEPENREGLPMDVYDAIPLEVVTNSTEDEIFDPYK